MRIIYLHQFFHTPERSGGTFSYDLARRLVDRGHEVRVVTSDMHALHRGWRVTEHSGIQIHWRSIAYSNRMSYARRLLSFAQFVFSASRRAACLPGDVLHAVSPPLTTALPAIRAANKKGIPLVLEACDLWPATAIAVGALRSRPLVAAARWMERYAYRTAAHITGTSPDTAAGVVASGVPWEKVTYIPMRSDVEAFRVPAKEGERFRRSRPWLQHRPLVVYTGAFGLVNGCQYLVRLAAATRRRDPQVRFLLVGAGREEQIIRRLAEQLGVLGVNLFIEPPVPRSEIPAILSAADLATSTVIDREPLWACSPSKLFDALAAGRPIAINHQGWLARLIRVNRCGMVWDAHQVESVVEPLIHFLEHEARAAGLRARRLAETQFDADLSVQKLEAIFCRLTGIEPPRQSQPATLRRAA